MSIKQELENILRYWIEHSVDNEYGGFYGKIGNDNIVDPQAPKGAVLNARILWSFSAAYNFSKKLDYLAIAERSYQYIQDFFIDRKYGSLYWSLNFDGSPLDTKKQIYAQAFAIYGLAEFYRASLRHPALTTAIEIYHDIEKYSLDLLKGGYLEAFTEDWKDLPDLRLSDKDANEKKTMNTHLHLLEAYTNLFLVWPDPSLKNRIHALIMIFLTHFIDADSYQQHLFFDEDWNRKFSTVSYGHDIETSWLLLKAAEAINDEPMISKVRQISVSMARACIEGLDNDGSMYYEYDTLTKELVKEKHWWVQAEAMVGFLNAWQLTGERLFYDQYEKVWNFIKLHIIDEKNGEWFWGVTADNAIMQDEDKAGFWKCPYHNCRACMEVMERLTDSSRTLTS